MEALKKKRPRKTRLNACLRIMGKSLCSIIYSSQCFQVRTMYDIASFIYQVSLFKKSLLRPSFLLLNYITEIKPCLDNSHLWPKLRLWWCVYTALNIRFSTHRLYGCEDPRKKWEVKKSEFSQWCFSKLNGHMTHLRSLFRRDSIQWVWRGLMCLCGPIRLCSVGSLMRLAQGSHGIIEICREGNLACLSYKGGAAIPHAHKQKPYKICRSEN